MRKPTFGRRVVLKVLLVFNNLIILPAMRWVGQDLDSASPTVSSGGYVEAVGPITPLVLMAAKEASIRDAEADPNAFQSELNACMEAVRTENIKGPALVMFGTLITKNNYPPDEALVRVCANFLQLGMYMERQSKTV